MADLQTLLAQRDALLAARFNGVRSVQVGDMQVQYSSDAEMAAAAAALTREIQTLQGGKVHTILIESSKGLK